MIKYKRFFSFGCSFTNYLWPTWADITAHQLQIESYNYGQAGMGNVGILHRILEADLEHSFNDNDLIIVMWSHWSREDRFLNGQWQSYGNVFNNPLYDDLFLKKYWDWDNDIIKNASAIILANKSYKINLQFTILPYGEIEYDFEKRSDSDLFKFYLPFLPVVPSFNYQYNQSVFMKLLSDIHPDIGQHVGFYNLNIAPYINTAILESNNYFFELQDLIIEKIQDNPKKKWYWKEFI